MKEQNLIEKDEFINKYLDYLLYEKNLSKNTLVSYKEDIKDLYNYQKNYLTLKDRDIWQYLNTLNNLSRRSLAHHITVLKSFYGFLESRFIFIDFNIGRTPNTNCICGITVYFFFIVLLDKVNCSLLLLYSFSSPRHTILFF